MKIFNEAKTMQLQSPDLEKGYLIYEKIQTGLTQAIVEVQEKGHYEVEREYPNGGKDMRWVVDVPYVAPKASQPIFEDIKVYIPYSAQDLVKKEDSKRSQELAAEQENKVRIEQQLYQQKMTSQENKKIAEQQFYQQYKAEIDGLNKASEYLRSTDCKVIEYAEGILSSIEFESIKQQRIVACDNVKRFQALIESACSNNKAPKVATQNKLWL